MGAPPSALGNVPEVNELVLLATEPVAILDRRLGKKGNKGVVYLLVQWSNKPKEEATYELYQTLQLNFLISIWKLEDKLLKRGRHLIQKK